MHRSRLLDKGREILLVYPEVTVINDRGIPTKTPATTPVEVRASIMEDRSSTAELPGQVTNRVVRMNCRSAPLGPWSRVFYNGEEWDLTFPPYRTNGASRSTEHIEFVIRSRNKIGSPL